MALNLTQPESVNRTVTKYVLDSVLYSVSRKELYITYLRLDENGGAVDSSTITLSGPEFRDFWSEANGQAMPAGKAVKRAIKRAAMKHVKNRSGQDGAIDD